MFQNQNRKKVVLQGLLALALIASIAGRVFVVSAAAPKPSYDYYLTGNAADVTRATSGGLLLMGGSTDVDAAFTWMIGKAGGGDFVVIRVTGADGYNPYVYGLGTVDSVETIVIKNLGAASDPFVVNKIRNAEALFIAGGDQKDYVTLWKGTPVEDAIHYLVTRNVPIGGTSAGLAIMGEFSFTAMNGTVDSSVALGNPYNSKVAVGRDFLVLPNMTGIITDSHFGARDRMGRLVVFLARIVKDGWAGTAKGIGVDEMTALAVEPNGSATVLGSGSVYFLRTPGMPEVCQSKKPLTYRNISVYRASGSATFNLSTWSGSGGTAYFLSAEAGVLNSTQAGGGIY
ncbi:MAG: cyanophycinase [Chloroflexi bacterium]|nr:cyanophycinase [Chloroflexota bacterium]